MDRINWSNRDDDLLGDRHEYTFPVGSVDEVQVSLQLYRNISDHYRLFAFTRAGDVEGMTFSVNLTTKKESGNIIFLEILLCDILRRADMDVDDRSKLVLGVFDSKTKTLLDASAEDFLNNFMVTALLKGHFQGNKGYELDVVPSMQGDYDLFAPAESNKKWESLRKARPEGRIPIPLAVRYKVLARDKSLCQRCGLAAGNGIILHVDHMKPVSLGGDNSLKNLWALCSKCNLGKGNRVIDRSMA